MDIIDILIAKSLTPAGNIENYVLQAQQAAQEVAEDKEVIDALVAQLSGIEFQQTTITNANTSQYVSTTTTVTSADSTTQTGIVKNYKEL